MHGHTHQDNFQVQRSNVKGTFAGVSIEHPSLTSSYYVFPSYRVYDIDPVHYNLINYYQYRFNTTKANKEDKPEWYLSYSFKEYYNVPNMEDRTFWKLAHTISTNDEYYKKYAWMLYAEGPRADAMRKNTANKSRVYCWLTCATFEQMDECIGGYNSFHLKTFLPQWEYAIYD